jgi:xanthine/CO dehydrogenase XdhC/CoxF family maturation factor
LNLKETAEVMSVIASSEEDATRSMALATIVSVKGSTYRRAGARLLVPREGESVGNLSGGCLEAEVEGLAKEVITRSEARLETFDLTAEDEIVWGWGLGCNGVAEVFIEPAGNASAMARVLGRAIEEDRSLIVITLVETGVDSTERGARLLVGDDGRCEGTLGDPQVDEAVLHEVGRRGHAGPTARLVGTAAGDVRVFVEHLDPPLSLVICGAGPDAVPLVQLASNLGWSVKVFDDRETLLRRDRFPEAVALLSGNPSEVVETAAVDGRSSVVVMSHNYLRDRDYLRALLLSEAPYIGMLGPRARTERLVEELARDGMRVEDARPERIHGPAGLDIGAEGPEEIAAAVVTEVLAVHRGRKAGYLKDRTGAIHDARRISA